MSAMSDELLGKVIGTAITRSVDLLDIDIERGGDGRTVAAYAAPFGKLCEVNDRNLGNIFEEVSRNAFNASIAAGCPSVTVLYNHGMTLEGEPHPALMVPIATHREARVEGVGLLTRASYHRGQLADSILEAIKGGSIKSYSHRSGIVRGRRRADVNGIPVYEWLELKLREYGPTPIPAVVGEGAHIVSVRSASLAAQLEGLNVDELDDTIRAELSAILDRVTSGTSSDDAGSATSSPTPPPTTTDAGATTATSVEEPEESNPALRRRALEVRQRRRRSGI